MLPRKEVDSWGYPCEIEQQTPLKFAPDTPTPLTALITLRAQEQGIQRWVNVQETFASKHRDDACYR